MAEKVLIKNILLVEASKPFSEELARATIKTVQLKGQNSY